MYFASDPTELGLSVSAMVWRAGELLLMRRADNGLWGLPGGFVEVGESVAAAARREVEEETGWRVEIGRLIGVYSDPGTNVVDYSFRKSFRKSFQKSFRKSVRNGSREGPVPDGGDRRVQVVNLCFEAAAVAPGAATTPEETLEMGFFAADALPEALVPIHRVRLEDGLAGRVEAAVR